MQTLEMLSLPRAAAAQANASATATPETQLVEWIEHNLSVSGEVRPLRLPELQIGMLDTLVQQAEDVAKLDAQLQTLILKVYESITALFEDESRVKEALKVDGKSALEYVQSFNWNNAKYRTDKPVSSLVESLRQEALSAEQDLKARQAAYQSTRQKVQQLERQLSGDLSVRTLADIVKPSDVVESEFLVTELLVVPKNQERSFLNSYETISKMVVPRSARKISEDEQYALYGVTVFKKFATDFIARAREQRWLPRTLDTAQEGQPNAQQEIGGARSKEKHERAELERLAAVAFSDIVKAAAHVKVIRVFCESVLRYGLPPVYATATFMPANVERAESKLVQQFGYLGGNAVARDSRGRIRDEDLSAYAGLVEQDYKPFVLFRSELP